MAKSYGKTPSGRALTDEVLDEMVAEAEAGYDLSKARSGPGPGGDRHWARQPPRSSRCVWVRSSAGRWRSAPPKRAPPKPR